MRWATSRGCSTKFVVELMTPGMRILSSGIFICLEVFPFVIVTRVGGLDADCLRPRLEGYVDDFQQRQIVGVRAFVIAPADVQPHAVGRQTGSRRIERGDVALGDFFPEFVVGEMPVLIVARRAEVGGVDLQQKSRFDDGGVFMPHHVGQRGDIGVFVRIMQVDDEARQNSRRRRGHENFGRPRFRGGGFEVRDVAVERALIPVAQFADAARKRDGREIAAWAAEVRMRQQVAAHHDIAALLGGARIGLDAADAMTDVGGVGRLAHLAVADDVDAGCDLLGDHIVDRNRRLGFECLRVDRLAGFSTQNNVNQRLRARQATGMRCQDAVGRSLHATLGNLDHARTAIVRPDRDYSVRAKFCNVAACGERGDRRTAPTRKNSAVTRPRVSRSACWQALRLPRAP